MQKLSTRIGISSGVALALVLGLAACGGSPKSDKTTFINQTTLDETTFQNMASTKWAQAQQALATQPFCLNAAYVSLYNAPCDQRPADPRAAQTNPSTVIVQARPDATDVPGTIACSVGHCDSMLLDGNTIAVPQSKPENMGPYEMENLILQVLGYNIQQR